MKMVAALAGSPLVGTVERHMSGSLNGTHCGICGMGIVTVPSARVAAGFGVSRKGTLFGDRKLKDLSVDQFLPKNGKKVTIEGGSKKLPVSPTAMWFQKTVPEPTSVPLEPIQSEAHLDQILSEAKERKQAIIIEWMAAWCRKCIFLKPKLEKLAAAYQKEIKFYYVDLNNVPKALVVDRGGVSKFPTIQLWKDGRKMEEIIGGKEAWQIMDEVRDMIGRNKSRV